MADAEPLHVVVDDDTETIRIDPETGTVETDRPDGSVVVQLDARKPKDGDDEDAENEWFANLADEVDPQELSRIAEDLIDAIQADDRSRGEYLEIRKRGMGLLGTKLEDPRSSVDSSVDGMSTVTNPLLLEAVLKGWANAQAELLPASGPVKIKDDGEETAQEDDLADAFQRDMNHWFTTTAPEYYPDTSHMLLWGTYLGGSGFKKVYRCPMRRRPVSESVEPEHLIVSNTTKDFRASARITHEIPMRPSVMKRMKFIGAYRDVALTQPTPTLNVVDAKKASMQGTTAQQSRPEDQDYTLYESQCELDLDQFIPEGNKLKGEGIPLPYLVTIDKDSREILALRRDWNEDNPECERKRMYVKYPYVPGPGFYGTGLLNILGNSSAAMTAAWRLSFDSAMFSNFPAGFISKIGNRQNSSNVRLSPGQWEPIDTGQQPIGNVLLPNPYKDVTAGMMAIIKEITEQSKSVGGSADIPTAEGIQNVPVGTMLAAIEQATKIMAAAHKGMHTAATEELELIVDLFRDNPEDFWRSNKVCPKDYWTAEKFNLALANCNLVPVSDPNVPSHIHRIAKALGLIQLLAVPDFKPLLSAKEVLMRSLRAMREDPEGLVIDPPPQAAAPPIEPDKLITAQAKAQEAQTKAQKVQIDAAGQQRSDMLKSDEMAAKERIANIDLQKEVIIHAHDAEHAADQHALAERAQTHDEISAAREHTQDAAQANREHGLATVTAAHDMVMDQAAHALAVKESNKPQPKPAAPKKSK
jgi:hypothetical protein